MDTRRFLETTLASSGFYCVWASNKSTGRKAQKFYGTAYEAMVAAREFDANGYDAYYALATFTEDNSRKVDNVHKLKSLFLDLDCGPSKDYANQNDALGALRRFCKELSLPKPVLINSGRGVHVYWRLKQEVSLIEWLPVAERLKQVCAERNLLADPAVTADAARILRVPETHNHKDDPPKPVFILGQEEPELVDFDQFTELLGGNPIPVPTKYVPDGSQAVLDKLTGNITSRFKTILDKTSRGVGCEQLKIIIKEQESLSEPMWRAGLSIAKFCVDVDKAAHLISHKHPDYTPSATQKKLDLIKGPYKCETFNEYNPDICANCPHNGNIGSPITLGKEIIEATTEDNIMEAEIHVAGSVSHVQFQIPQFPRPYFRGSHGGVYMRVRNDDDVDEKVVYHNDLYVVKRLRDVESGESIVMRLHLPKDGVRDFTIPLATVTSKDGFAKEMAKQGVALAKMDQIMNYVLSWVNELQETTIAEDAHRQFGWTEDCKSFVLGADEYTPKGKVTNHPSTVTAQFFPEMRPKGSLDEWKKMIGFFNREGLELHQYIICTNFGAPLMEFIPNINAANLHIFSKDSGLGKTTSLLAGLSIWGRPKGLILDDQDTRNFKMNRAEVYRSLPVMMDELTNTKPEELSNLAYQLTSGKQRGRMQGSVNAERHRGLPWSTAFASTGNASAVEKISGQKIMPKAEAQRIMEYKVEFAPLPKDITGDMNEQLETNYGHAGPIYVEYLITHLDEVKQLLKDVQRKVDTRLQLTNQNRFWSAHIAVSLTGGIIAGRLGLIDFDMKKIFKWTEDLIAYNRKMEMSMDSSVEGTLNDYINEHWGNILMIKSTDDLRKDNNNGLDQLIVPDASPRIKLVARYETDIKRIYLVPKPLKEWCIKHQVNYGSFRDELFSKLNGRRGKVRLGKGTHMNMPPADVLIVDCEFHKDGIED